MKFVENGLEPELFYRRVSRQLRGRWSYRKKRTYRVIDGYLYNYAQTTRSVNIGRKTSHGQLLSI